MVGEQVIGTLHHVLGRMKIGIGPGSIYFLLVARRHGVTQVLLSCQLRLVRIYQALLSLPLGTVFEILPL